MKWKVFLYPNGYVVLPQSHQILYCKIMSPEWVVFSEWVADGRRGGDKHEKLTWETYTFCTSRVQYLNDLWQFHWKGCIRKVCVLIILNWLKSIKLMPMQQGRKGGYVNKEECITLFRYFVWGNIEIKKVN